MPDLSILIVENEPVDEKRIRACLNAGSSSFNSSTARSLASALIQLEQDRFDAILIDPDLPDVQGLEAIRRLRAGAAETAIVVVADACAEHLCSAVRSTTHWVQDCIEKRQLSSFALDRAIRYAIDLYAIQQEMEALFTDLASALQRCEMLYNTLPVCARCGKVMSRDGSRWLELDEYLRERSQVNRIHRLCSGCCE